MNIFRAVLTFLKKKRKRNYSEGNGNGLTYCLILGGVEYMEYMFICLFKIFISKKISPNYPEAVYSFSRYLQIFDNSLS